MSGQQTNFDHSVGSLIERRANGAFQQCRNNERMQNEYPSSYGIRSHIEALNLLYLPLLALGNAILLPAM